MDTLGDADEDDYSDEPTGARGRSWRHVTSTESFAVASVVLSVCSFFSGSLFQFLSFVVIGTSFSDQRSQYLIFASPTAVLSGLAVALGVTAGRREPEDRWVAGAAGAGVIVGGVGLVASLLGVVLALTLGESGDVTY